MIVFCAQAPSINVVVSSFRKFLAVLHRYFLISLSFFLCRVIRFANTMISTLFPFHPISNCCSLCRYFLVSLSALTIITVGQPKLGMVFLVMMLFSLRILFGIMFIKRKSYQKMGSMESLIFFKREQQWFLQRFCCNMVSRFTRLCKCQESLLLPFLEHTIQDLVMVRS